MNPIPISKPFIGAEEKAAVMEVLDSGMLVQGPKVAKLESDFCEVVGTKHAIATSNGTTALHVALLSHGIGPGDEVITSPFTFIASVNSIVYTGARPVFADIDPNTFCIDPDQIRSKITSKTKAIMPVHIYGLPCNMAEIMKIAEEHGLVVIEDCAQSIGGAFQGKMTGSFGTGCFSLYATKNIMTGEGGMITTNDDAVADLAKMIRGHGMKRRYYHDVLGFNFRMMDLSAAIGVVQLGRLNDFTEARRKNARYLNQHIKRVRVPTCHADCAFKGCTVPCGHVYHQYTVRVEDDPGDGSLRDSFVQRLTERGVGCGVFYPVPANKQQHMIDFGFGEAEVPIAEKLSHQVFSLPVHPALTQEDLERIVAEVNDL
jgi:perosamine synthetase